MIDDEADTRRMVRFFLADNLPHSVRVTACGDTAWREGAIDLADVAVAIVDVMMPVVDGREILAHLRDHHPKVHRIAWTAAPETFREEIERDGLAHAIVAKPGLEELRGLVLSRVGT